MRIFHVVLPGASEYEKKSQRIDFEALRGEHQIIVVDDPQKAASADVAQIYGPPSWPANLTEAVPEEFFGGAARVPARPAGVGARRHTIGSFLRQSIIPIVERTIPRLHRTRDDIEWLLLERPPSRADFDQFDAWVDPTAGEKDWDGFVAEALVAGKIVVASRTPINVKRLEEGRIGLLVRPGDANELTHAILAALFKPEVAQQKIEAARQTISKFHPRQRLRALVPLLEAARR
jgi:hypothetical protein